MPRIDKLLLAMMENSASDLHIVVGQKPKYRIHGEVEPIPDHPAMDEKAVADYLFEIITDAQRQQYLESLDFDFAYGENRNTELEEELIKTLKIELGEQNFATAHVDRSDEGKPGKSYTYNKDLV